MKNFFSDLLIYGIYYFVFVLFLLIVLTTIISIVVIKKYGWKYFNQKFKEAIKEHKEFFDEPLIDMNEQRKKWK